MTRRPYIKICGITNKNDALFAAQLKVWALGFVFADSPRRVSKETVRDIVDALPADIMTVGVFVNEKRDVIQDIVEECGLTIAQLHGQESPAFCDTIAEFAKTMKAFHIRDTDSLKGIDRYRVDFYLLDAYSETAAGGTGRTCDWQLARTAKARVSTLVLSGGLNPDNILDAVKAVEPYAVDVSSGVEASPGKKDKALLEKFVLNVRGV